MESYRSIPFLVFTILELVIGLTGNLLIIITFIGRRELRRKPSDLLILNLALADIGSLTTYLPWHLAALLTANIYNGRKIFISLATMNLFISSMGILAIAIDRFIAVVYPLHYKSFMTRKRTWIMIAVSWIAGFILVGVTHTLSLYFEFHDDYYRKIFCAFKLAQLIFVTALYVKIFSQAKKQMADNQHGISI